jgi:hypothetical protein
MKNCPRFERRSKRGRAEMPDDQSLTDLMAARGARPVTIRARLTEGERLVRHAAWRQPMEHEDSPLIDRVYAKGWLGAVQYANACACAALYDASGLGSSQGVATYDHQSRATGSGEAYGPEDEWRGLLRDCQARDPVGLEFLLLLLGGDKKADGEYAAARAGKLLDTLDGVAARWDGERYREES